MLLFSMKPSGAVITMRQHVTNYFIYRMRVCLNIVEFQVCFCFLVSSGFDRQIHYQPVWNLALLNVSQLAERAIFALFCFTSYGRKKKIFTHNVQMQLIISLIQTFQQWLVIGPNQSATLYGSKYENDRIKHSTELAAMR